MADPGTTVKHAAASAAHPVETAKDLAAEADRGRSPRTPLIAITGVTLFMGSIFVVMLAAALTLYFVYGGK